MAEAISFKPVLFRRESLFLIARNKKKRILKVLVVQQICDLDLFKGGAIIVYSGLVQMLEYLLPGLLLLLFYYCY